MNGATPRGIGAAPVVTLSRVAPFFQVPLVPGAGAGGPSHTVRPYRTAPWAA